MLLKGRYKGDLPQVFHWNQIMDNNKGPKISPPPSNRNFLATCLGYRHHNYNMFSVGL